MNERIRDVAEQAGMQHNFMLDDSSRDIEVFVTKYDGSVPSIKNWEKFAELLIEKVCYDIMNVHGASPERIALVAKHYGVEL